MREQTSSLPYLPCPRRERWQPLRSGLVNLYKYDREEFHYEDGRLLLRGNNGTGKSRILALQLPFLLDGEVNPERLEPDADPSRKIEWNLLMDRYPDRTGYTWIEFGRRDEKGRDFYLTLGCGLSAVEGQAGTRRWFFITNQRIGKDLELVSDSRQVLTRDRLKTKLGSDGRVFEAAGPYRRAVNDALFHLDEERYAGLVNLLIQLRRPQLTRRLEEHRLSRALSEALPPVSATLVAHLAEAFRDLQSDRNQLDSSRAALSAVEQFLTGYRIYAEIAAKRFASRVLSAHEEYESSMQEILAAEAECDRSLARLASLQTELQNLSSEKHALQAEIAAFQESPNLKDGQSLEQKHREAAEKRRDADDAAADLEAASRVRSTCSEELIQLKTILEQRQHRLAAATEEAARAAILAGLESLHTTCIGTLNLKIADVSELNSAREKTGSAILAQGEKAKHAGSLNEPVACAETEFHRAAADRDQLSGLLDDARERLNTTRTEYQAAVTAFLNDTSNWTSDLNELPLPFDEPFLRSVSDWCDKPHGPSPFAAAIRKSVDELNVNFSETRAYLKQLDRTRTEELNRLETELESLDASQHDRLPELQTAITEAQAKLDSVADSISELDGRESVLRNEVLTVPPDDAVRAAYEYSIAVSRHVDSLRKTLAESEEYVAQKQLQLDQVTESRNRAADDLGIMEWIGDLAAIQAGIMQYRLGLSSLWPAVEAFREARIAGERARINIEQAVASEERQKERASRLKRRAIAAEIARDAAGQAVHNSPEEIFERRARAQERLDALRSEEEETRRRYHDTEIAVTRLDERLRGRTEVLNGETDRRDSAAASLRTFASTGLLNLILPEVDGGAALTWSTTRTVEVACELVSRLGNIEAGSAAWDHQQKSVPAQFTTLMQALSAQGFESTAIFRDDVFVATAVVAGQERTMADLRQILFENVAARRLLLDASTREILENQLVGKVSGHLCELLHAAEEQVRQMNLELENHPMSTGMKLRFVWRPTEMNPSGMAEARRRLMQFNDVWSADERRMLGLFLQEQIEAVYSTIEGAGWEESLAEALDYRKWHGFGIERFQDGVWKRLTERTYGTGSGGEKAVALTLPQFAAAAAFYRAADPLAPRLILLDEAFVGIDADMRAKCMGLIHVYDLDFMMTSEREWGCYPTLPGLAIYQLSTRPGIDAIGLTRWAWNGSRRDLAVAAKREEIFKKESNSNEPYDAHIRRDLVAAESRQRR